MIIVKKIYNTAHYAVQYKVYLAQHTKMKFDNKFYKLTTLSEFWKIILINDGKKYNDNNILFIIYHTRWNSI